MARTLVKTIKASNESISVIGENTAASTNTVSIIASKQGIDAVQPDWKQY